MTVNSILMTTEEVSDDLCNEKNKTFKVCKHATGGILRARQGVARKGWKLGHVLMDFIIFKFLLTNNLDILAKRTKT